MVTLSIIGICVAVYVLQIASAGVATGLLQMDTAFAPSEPWRYLTSAFLHSPGGLLPLHLLFNMYVLYVTGPYLEQVLGRGRFLALYLVSAFGGSVVFQLVAALTGEGGAAVGASGAVFGIFSALLVVQRRMRLPLGQIGTLVAVNFVIGFVLPRIAWEAHLGGLLTGAAVAAVMVLAPRRHRTPVQVAGTAAVVLVLVVLAVAAGSVGVPLLR